MIAQNNRSYEVLRDKSHIRGLRRQKNFYSEFFFSRSYGHRTKFRNRPVFFLSFSKNPQPSTPVKNAGAKLQSIKKNIFGLYKQFVTFLILIIQSKILCKNLVLFALLMSLKCTINRKTDLRQFNVNPLRSHLRIKTHAGQ